MWNAYGYQGNRNVPQVPGQRPVVKPEPIDWNLVAVLDPEIIQRIKDFDSLQKIITNFTSANFTDGCSKVLTHPLSIRLCQLLQIGFQIMDSSQKELKKIIDDDAAYKEKLTSALKKLKTKLTLTEEKLKIKSIPYDKCPVCGKKFKSLDYVDKHIYTRHNELSECWDCMRGRKNPAKEPELQQVLDEITRLKASISKNNQQNQQVQQMQQVQQAQEMQQNQNIPQYMQQNIDIFNNNDSFDEQQSEIKRNELDAAVNELGQSIKQWNEQRDEADHQFNIFNKPSNFVPPAINRPLFIGEDDIQGKNAALDLFTPLQEEQINESKTHSSVNVIEEEEEDNGDDLPSLGLPQVNAQLNPEESQRLFNAGNDENKKKIVKKAKKILYKQEKPVLQTAKKSEISDAIDLVKRKEKAVAKKFTQGINGDAVTPTYVRRNLSIDDPDYTDFRNYIQGQLENEYPLNGVKPMEQQPVPKVMRNGREKPVDFGLIRTGEIPDQERNEQSISSSFMNTISIEENDDSDEEVKDASELPSFSYESIDESPSTQSIKQPKVELRFEAQPEVETQHEEQKTIISTHENSNVELNRSTPKISITEEPIMEDLPKEEAKKEDNDDEYTYEYYSDTENISGFPDPPPLEMSSGKQSIPVRQEEQPPELPQDEDQEDINNVTALKQSDAHISDLLISPIPKQKSPTNMISRDSKKIIPVTLEEEKERSIIDSPLEELEDITKSPPSKHDSEFAENSLTPPTTEFQLPPSSSKQSKRENPLRSNISISSSSQKTVVDKNSFLMSPPPTKLKKSSPSSSITKQKRPTTVLTPTRQSPKESQNILDSQVPKPVFVDDFTFEELPKEDPVNKPLKTINPKSPPPHASLSPSAISPKKRKKIIMVDDIPVEPSSDIDIDSMSEIKDDELPLKNDISIEQPSQQAPVADSMIEGSFTDQAIVQDSINATREDKSFSGFSIEDSSSKEEILISGSPVKPKKKRNVTITQRDKPKKRKPSPRREQLQEQSEISAIEPSNDVSRYTSEGELSDGGFDITEELKKLDEDVKRNEVGASLFMKSPVRGTAKSRFSKKGSEESSFLLKNRVSIFDDKSQASGATNSSFSVIPRTSTQQESSNENVSLLQGARHIRKSVRKKSSQNQ